jgi:hypothetical protein
MKKFAIITVSAAILLGATACGTEGTPSSAPASAPPASSTAGPAPASTPESVTPSAEPTETPTEESSVRTANFGESYKYDDGTTIAVSKPTRGVSGQYSAGGNPGDSILIFKVTVTNGTKKVMEAGTVYATMNYGVDSTAADQVFDEGINGFEGKILPGKKQTATMAFSVPAGATDVLMSIKPSFEYEDAMFLASSVK